MADYEGPTIPLRRGDHNSGRFTVKRKDTGAVADLSGWLKFWLTVKRSIADADVDAVIEVSTPSGGMTNIQPLLGLVDYEITPALTSSLGNAELYFWYDFQGKDPSGRIKTILSGRALFCPDVKIGTT